MTGPATISVNEVRTSTANATVKPMAVRRTFHHGRPSSMSYARLRLPTIATTAAELLQMAPRIPIVRMPPLSAFGKPSELFLEETEHIWRSDWPQNSDDIFDKIREWKETRQSKNEQDGREQRQEEVVCQLSGQSETVVGAGLFRGALQQLAPADWDIERGEHQPESMQRNCQIRYSGSLVDRQRL